MKTFLYIIKCKTFVKIGITDDVNARLASLQTGNPFTLTLAKSYQIETRKTAVLVEKLCHSLLSDYHQNGEWFEASCEKVTPLIETVIETVTELKVRNISLSRLTSSGETCKKVKRKAAGKMTVSKRQEMVAQMKEVEQLADATIAKNLKVSVRTVQRDLQIVQKRHATQ